MVTFGAIQAQSLKRVLREANYKYSPLAYWYGYQIAKALTKGQHKKVRDLAEKMTQKGISVGYYYLAQSYFLCGEYQLAEQAVRKVSNFTKMPEAIFLYSDILVKQHRKQDAWCTLAQCALENRRKKVWIYLANLVENTKDFVNLEEHIQYVRNTTNFLKNDLLFHPRINAALRAGLNNEALELAKQQVQTSKIENKAPSSFTDKLAEKALEDLKKTLDKHQIPFFLISGTLLGCIREGKLLGHDKDIDVGVWDEYNYEELEHYLSTSGYFYIVPTRTKHLITLRHVNGIVIDVFIHYREPNDYWHAGVKIKWHNLPFNLTTTAFLGGHYLIPENYDLYLTENYGDWRTPKTQFDSAFDTPNMEVFNETEMEIYKYRKNFQ
ncbi:hypothetical protein [Actinobacillus minor]|uniref:hypothetical protein n=1 Tax=Actinobacillus minor TaxID=51047 RepID=UPI0026EF7613|nr:hypothetical protein [Actinobacillus minor]